jgi:hypothetical protein
MGRTRGEERRGKLKDARTGEETKTKERIGKECNGSEERKEQQERIGKVSNMKGRGEERKG